MKEITKEELSEKVWDEICQIAPKSWIFNEWRDSINFGCEFFLNRMKEQGEPISEKFVENAVKLVAEIMDEVEHYTYLHTELGYQNDSQVSDYCICGEEDKNHSRMLIKD